MMRMTWGGTNVIRPRKPTSWASISPKPGKIPIFKIGENDFTANITPGELRYNNHYYSNQPTSHKMAGSNHKACSDEMKKSVVNQLEKYCENTTLHGLRYVGDSQLSFGERIFWFISFSLAVGFAAYYISNIYDKWKSSPVIISFSPFDAELSSIPFPAVTICNMNQAKRTEAERILRSGSTVEKKLLDDACNGNATFDNTENISWDALKNFLVRVGNSCSDMLKYCQWGSEKINCDDVFNNDLTDEGLCCSFNRLPPEKIFRNMKDLGILNQTYPTNVYDWNAEKGFGGAEYDDYIPRRPLGAGAHLGLSVILDANIDNYYCSSTRSTGFKVMLSNPIETPKMADFGFLVSPGFESRITIEPSIREATSSLRDVAIEKRQCYFSNERPLQYYRVYSKMHCNRECKAKTFASKCGCVPFYMRRDSNESIKICPLRYNCTVVNNDIIDEENVNKKDSEARRGSCNCLKSCTGIHYHSTHTSSPMYNFTTTIGNHETFDNDYMQKNLIKADFFFESITYYKTEKRAIFNFNDLVAYTGGLLGFFVGFSFLSAVEAVFFLIWTPWKKSYTQMNCLQECHSNFSLRECHCIPYFLPKNIYTTYCGQADDNCTNFVKEGVDDLKNGSYLDGECQCKPGCFEINYRQSVSSSPLLYSALMKSNITFKNINSLIVADFFFNTEISQRQIKDLLYGFSEILSNFGGILSLCLGISFLSVVEIMYYASLRWLCIYARIKRKKKTDYKRIQEKLRIMSRNNAAEFVLYPPVIIRDVQVGNIM